jgi:(p)ppGpp synthase/HD superfamily hydrolase
MDLKPDLESIQTCLLHDVIEDSIVTKEEIEKEF